MGPNLLRDDLLRALTGDRSPGIAAACQVARDVAGLERAHPDHPPRALMVGGAVRDALLGLDVPDVDLEVFGVPPARLEELLQDRFPERVHEVGRAFGVFKIALAGDSWLDVAIPRRDSKTGAGHKGFTVTGDPFMSREEAARRRDFTINAVAFDPISGDVVDPHGGIRDLAQGVLRVVDPATFTDDPLRVWRGVQFAARFDLEAEPGTRDLLWRIVARGDLAELPKERVTEELRKLLTRALRPSTGFVLARDVGAVAESFPELEALAATPQDPDWHPEGDVWVHTMMVLDRGATIVRKEEYGLSPAERLHVLLGCLCHDLGKPATTARAMKDGALRIVSPLHEIEGENPTRAFLARLTFGDEALQSALALTRWHLAPYAYYRSLGRGEMDRRAYANAIRRVLKRIHPVSWPVLLALAEADWRGRTLPDADGPFAAGDSWRETIHENGLDREPEKPLVQGRDVLALGIAPGPRVGELVDAIEDARDRGEVVSRDQALELLQRLASLDRL